MGKFMVGELRLVEIQRSRRAANDTGVSASVGRAFDLTADLAPAKARCCEAEPLANAFGMMEALADKGTRTAGFEKAVYVMQAGDQSISKIGVSANAVNRLVELQGNHYRPLSLHAVVFTPLRNAVAIEQAVLRRASAEGKRMCGEWVEYPPETVLDMIFDAAIKLGHPICDGRTWFENMVNRAKQIHRRQRAMAQAHVALKRAIG